MWKRNHFYKLNPKELESTERRRLPKNDEGKPKEKSDNE